MPKPAALRDDPAPAEPPRRRRPRGSTGPSALQVAKSEAMRQHILATIVECLVEASAAEVSVATIAKRGDISRGGVQYHFTTRRELLCAALEYIIERRLNQFRDDLASFPRDADVIDMMVDAHWRHLGERDFRAYQELVLAARSDPALAAEFAPKYARFMADWYAIAEQGIGWDTGNPEVAQTGHMVHYMLEGMAYGQLVGQISPEVTAQLLASSKAMIRQAIAATRA